MKAVNVRVMDVRHLTDITDLVRKIHADRSAAGTGGVRSAEVRWSCLQGLDQDLVCAHAPGGRCFDERLIGAFADENGLDPGDVGKARAALGGQPWERELP